MYLFDTSIVSSFEHLIIVCSPQQNCEMESQNNRVLMYEGCFGLNRVAKLRRADYLPTRFPPQYEILTASRSCKRMTLQGCYALSQIVCPP